MKASELVQEKLSSESSGVKKMDAPLEQSGDCLEDGSSFVGGLLEPDALLEQSDEPVKACRSHRLVLVHLTRIEPAALVVVQDREKHPSDQRRSSGGRLETGSAKQSMIGQLRRGEHSSRLGGYSRVETLHHLVRQIPMMDRLLRLHQPRRLDGQHLTLGHDPDRI